MTSPHRSFTIRVVTPDRFGRIVDQKWVKGTSDTDRFQYSYDRDSNVTARNNLVNTAYNETYTSDGWNQLAFDRGTLRNQDWNLDAQGNWNSLTENNTTTVSRTHNKQNQVTGVGSATLTYDANGNMTKDETGKTYKYDAWNRVVEVKDTGSNVIAAYGYDALNRRVKETHYSPTVTRDLFYSDQWQVLEEQVSGDPVYQYVWSPVYVDALVLRDKNTDADDLCDDERLYVQQDANYNVTALLSASGSVVERFIYDPFGVVSELAPDWSQPGTSYGLKYLHQGGRLDSATGLYHFRNRDYSPTLGKWNKPDPIRFKAGDSNLYRYVNNDPVGAVDPSGLELHHIIFQALYESTAANPLPFSDVAIAVFRQRGGCNMIEAPGHVGFRGHGAYNAAVRAEVDAWLTANRASAATMTEAQARQLVQHIRNSPIPAIRDFFARILNPATRAAGTAAARVAGGAAARTAAARSGRSLFGTFGRCILGPIGIAFSEIFLSPTPVAGGAILRENVVMRAPASPDIYTLPLGTIIVPTGEIYLPGPGSTFVPPPGSVVVIGRVEGNSLRGPQGLRADQVAPYQSGDYTPPTGPVQ